MAAPAAKTPKGEARRRSIMAATFDIIVAEGLGAASQDAIAQRAKVTQSAVRHHFPTKESLLKAFFLEAVERLQQGFDTPPVDPETDPRAELLRLVNLHLDAISKVDRVFFFEALAYWTRDSELNAIRNAWHERVLRHYQNLLEMIHPHWSANEIGAAAQQVLTLIQGCWLTLESHEASGPRKNAVLGAMTRLVG